MYSWAISGYKTTIIAGTTVVLLPGYNYRAANVKEPSEVNTRAALAMGMCPDVRGHACSRTSPRKLP